VVMSDGELARSLAGGRFVTTGELDAMTAELAEIVRRTGLDRTLAVGEMILNRFFGGQAEAWRVRRRNKRNSVRRLAERPGCPLSRSALNQAVGVYVAVKALPCVRTFGHIDASHVAAVLPLRIDDQERWLRRADGEQWSVRRLKEAITGERRSAGERRGRPPTAQTVRLLSMLLVAIDKVEHEVAVLGDLAPSSADSETLETIMHRLGSVQERLLHVYRTTAGFSPGGVAVSQRPRRAAAAAGSDPESAAETEIADALSVVRVVVAR
jgi:hypothetical protein